MDQVTVHLEVEVCPTESEEKVKKALWNLFGDVPRQTKPLPKGIVLTAEARLGCTIYSSERASQRPHP